MLIGQEEGPPAQRRGGLGAGPSIIIIIIIVIKYSIVNIYYSIVY